MFGLFHCIPTGKDESHCDSQTICIVYTFQPFVSVIVQTGLSNLLPFEIEETEMSSLVLQISKNRFISSKFSNDYIDNEENCLTLTDIDRAWNFQWETNDLNLKGLKDFLFTKFRGPTC